ncbi:Gfo/Idh/MocA family oxidoreductase [Geodermatophilus sp. URMC 61]|uniref:Gfo/Idh/MocA family oxidoreductase n=1 Tax=Geodermatophilus sp. URMC 61 TaxID=3423411 RepID=UPI00406C5068
MSRLRVAVVGTGFIAGRHLAALAGFDDVEVVAVADVVPTRAGEVAARYGARSHPDGTALLETEELDAVWLCVPPFAHGPLEAAALARGLPFFVEKPLGPDLATAEAIAVDVEAAGLTTAVGYHWRHVDLVHRAQELLRDRSVHLVTGAWLDRTPGAPWWSRRAASGGQVVEQTTHLFDLARLLAGEVDTVTAVERPAPEGDVPAAATTLLTFASGAVGTISSARVLGRRHHVGLQLVTEGLAVEVTERGLSDHELRVADADGEETSGSEEDPIAVEDREFLDVLLGEAPGVRVPYAEGLRSHALACAADRAAREGRPARLGD